MSRSKKPLCVVDTDTLLYRCAAISEDRSISVHHVPTGLTKDFKNRTELKKAVKARGKELNDDYVITDIQEPHPVSHCLQSVKSGIENIKERFSDHEIIFVAGDSDNFRLELPLPSKYKGNREETIHPIHLIASHEYLNKQYKSVRAKGYEADDLVGILACEAVKKRRKATIVSPDKDSRQFVGVSVTDYEADSETTLVEAIHPLEWVYLPSGKKLVSYGIPWVAIQLLNGDSTDCYKPSELAGIKIGEAGVYEILKDCKSVQDYLLAVVDTYKKWYTEQVEYTDCFGIPQKKDYKEILDLYFKCVKMKESESDSLDSKEFFMKYGVKIE